MKQNANKLATLCLSAAMPCLVACGDAQAGRDYQGEPLLQIRGSITRVDGETLASDLVPAIVWRSEGETLKPDGHGNERAVHRAHIQDLAVQGKFPASFALRLFEPPPEAAMTAFFDDVPNRAALGYIIATLPDHPAEAVEHEVTSSDYECDEDYLSCTEVEEWCYSEECFRRETQCGEDILTKGDSCKLVSEQGDPAANGVPWWFSRGIAQNYFVVYLTEPEPAVSVTAAYFNGYRAMKAGMHLIALRLASDEELEAQDVCRSEAALQALARHNERAGTNYASLDELDAALQTEAEWDAFSALEEAVQLELRCTFYDEDFALSSVPTDTAVDLRLGDTVRPLF